MQVENLKVYFQYGKKEVNTPEGTKLITDPQAPIEAVIKNTESKEIVLSRRVELRHGDQPNKQLGRKYAFAKLMNHARTNQILPGKVVENFWKQFGRECKQPNTKLAY